MMAFDSRAVAIIVVALGTTGCWTGQLIESARLHERVRTYERIAVVGEEIHLDYTAEVTTRLPDRDDDRTFDAPRPSKLRGAVFPLSEMTVVPEHPVDAFPLERTAFGVREGQALPIVIEPEVAASPRSKATDLGFTPPILETPSLQTNPPASVVARVDRRDGRHQGFRLCSTTGDPCVGYFYSAALYDDPLAWWVYPAAPFAVALDIAMLPFQVLTLPVLLVVSD
jgi:hypothetical protein